MRTRIPARDSELERVRCRFELWRHTRKPRSPIPETLWASAVELAQEHGLHRTARALRLNYYSLKERLPGVVSPPRRPQNKATFVELLPIGASGISCTIEMENVQGGKMKIHLQGMGGPDLALLTHSFWRATS
jgi:hypothetical protein